VRMELMKLLIAPAAAPTCEAMMDAGILGPVLGGVPLVANLRRIASIEATAGLAPDACRRLGALGVGIVEDAERLSQRLRLSNAEAERLLSMGNAWWRISPTDEQAMRALLYRIGEEHFRDRVSLAWSRAGVEVSDDDWLRALQLPERWNRPKFCLKATDFIARGLSPGPQLGKALAAAEDAWVAANFPLDQATLAAIADAAARAAG
jgi:poly(A) polymerase